MPTKRVNPQAIKLHRSYDVRELAERLGVHKNTVRHWQRQGLEPLDRNRRALFQGATVRAFLTKRRASRKAPCPPGMFYCFRCRRPRPPALGMVDFIPGNSSAGNLRAFCASCETVMNRRAPLAALAAIMPGCDVQITQARLRLTGRPSPSLNCNSGPEAPTP